MHLNTIMDQRSPCHARQKKFLDDPLRYDLEKLRRHPKDEHLSTCCSVQNRGITLNKTSADGYLSPCRKSMPSRPIKLEVQDGELPRRRGSVYQSSQEVRKLKKLQGQIRHAEWSCGNDTFLSFDIVDSLSRNCKSGDGRYDLRKISTQTSSQDGMPSVTSNATQITEGNSPDFLDLSFRILLEEQSTGNASVTRRDTVLDDLLGITLSPDKRCQRTPEKLLGKGSSERLKSSSKEVFVSVNKDDGVSKCDKLPSLPKSSSAKVGGISLQHGEDSSVTRATPKTRYSPLARMLDPLVKSKSLRNPAQLELENAQISMLSSDVCTIPCGTQKIDGKEPFLESVEELTILSSPVHLSGTLKLESKHKVSSFVFSLNNSDDVYYAKTWRTGSPFDWVYTFYSNKRKTQSATWGMKEGHKQQSLMIGQMQVSCYLCSEVGSSGSLDNYTVLEFVLYDIAQARSSSAIEGKKCQVVDKQRRTSCAVECLHATDAKKLGNLLNPNEAKHQDRQALGDRDLDSPESHPWSPADLLPHLEVAAIVIQIPFDNKERPKNVNKIERCRDMLNEFHGCQSRTSSRNNLHPTNMKVIMPSGRHGLPTSTDGCPSSLLYRWRSGGRCDCGGWDMGCPITVLAANSSEQSADFSLKKGYKSVKLGVEGSKDTIPALLIKMSGQGEYSVSFHAQFSALQSFSISIALLHLLESFKTDYGENIPILHSNSLKALLEEELRQLLDTVAEEEKRKVKKRLPRPTPSYNLIDPPFSPIARV